MALAWLAGILSVLMGSCPNDPSDVLFGQYDGNAPGATIAVVRDGAIIYERSFGIANLDTGEKASSQTNYRLASITKTFTGMAIHMLAEKKLLSIGDPVTRFLPELNEVAPKVTLKHLLMHTSGLPEYEKLLPQSDPKAPLKQIVDRDVLAMIKSQKPITEPGKRYRYNNTGYALLALVIERVSKLSYAEFLHRNIFTPVGMASSLVYAKDAKIPNRALGYSATDLRFTNTDQDRTTAVLGDGGVYSSAKDLALWIDALDHHKLIDAKRLAEATSAQVRTDTPGLSYGLGWRVGEERGERVAFHTGTTSGFKNVLLWVPSRRLGVIVLTNRRQGDPLWLGWLLLQRFWDPVQSAVPMPTIAPTPVLPTPILP
ncbi:MAG: beta-lactamase family protein [Deltaproteobacteria bacterium]|nr:beta-lactamase family protein [Deltaproteobacteria bacterium]